MSGSSLPGQGTAAVPILPILPLTTQPVQILLPLLTLTIKEIALVKGSVAREWVVAAGDRGLQLQGAVDKEAAVRRGYNVLGLVAMLGNLIPAGRPGVEMCGGMVWKVWGLRQKRFTAPCACARGTTGFVKQSVAHAMTAQTIWRAIDDAERPMGSRWPGLKYANYLLLVSGWLHYSP